MSNQFDITAAKHALLAILEDDAIADQVGRDIAIDLCIAPAATIEGNKVFATQSGNFTARAIARRLVGNILAGINEGRQRQQAAAIAAQPQEPDASDIASFVLELTEIVNAGHKASGTVTFTNEIVLERGPKFTRVVSVGKVNGQVNSRSAYAFIENATGDLYKSAGWKGPAKNAPKRGNIRNGTWKQWCGTYGIHSAR